MTRGDDSCSSRRGSLAQIPRNVSESIQNPNLIACASVIDEMPGRSPTDRQHSYRVRLSDGFESPLHHDQLVLLAEYKEGDINDSDQVLAKHGLFDRGIRRVQPARGRNQQTSVERSTCTFASGLDGCRHELGRSSLSLRADIAASEMVRHNLFLRVRFDNGRGRIERCKSKPVKICWN